MKEVIRSADPRIAALIRRQATQHIDRDQLGLDRIASLLDRLGRPQDRLPPIFHVAGTNGKGSTCAFVRAGLEASGYRVHAFTSPHLVRYNERIRLAGTLIDDDTLARLMSEVLDHSDEVDGSLFEVNLAVAFLAFNEVAADACILEVGLGGRFDATNVVDRPIACGIASIGLDHQQFLGTTLGEIAAEKAGIAKPGVPILSLAQAPEAESAIIAAVEARGGSLLLEGRDWALDRSLAPGLPGPHQLRNANLAWQMLRAQGELDVSDADFRRGIAKASWPARFQKLSAGPLTKGVETWLDGAHNDDAARALAATLSEHGAKHLVLGILANKDADALIEALKPHAKSLTFVPVPDHDHHDPRRLAERFGGRAAASLEDALAGLPGPRLIAGSLYLAGEALRQNEEAPD